MYSIVCVASERLYHGTPIMSGFLWGQVMANAILSQRLGIFSTILAEDTRAAGETARGVGWKLDCRLQVTHGLFLPDGKPQGGNMLLVGSKEWHQQMLLGLPGGWGFVPYESFIVPLNRGLRRTYRVIPLSPADAGHATHMVPRPWPKPRKILTARGGTHGYDVIADHPNESTLAA